MQKVRITYSANLDEIGTVREVDADEARILLRESRAVAYDPADDADPAEVLVAQHTRAELAGIAADRGVEVDPKATKADLAAAVVDATS